MPKVRKVATHSGVVVGVLADWIRPAGVSLIDRLGRCR